MLIVRDVGGGFPGTLTSRIFEPLLTTGEAGKGNGLGLSVSYGVNSDAGW